MICFYWDLTPFLVFSSANKAIKFKTTKYLYKYFSNICSILNIFQIYFKSIIQLDVLLPPSRGREPVFFHFPPQGGSADAEIPGGALAIAAVKP